MNRTKLVILSAVAAVMVTIVSASLWLYAKSGTQGLREYARIVGGMTVDEVRDVMGREEDIPDNRRTATGEFERSWTFEDGTRYTIVFDNEGRSTYKELAPAFAAIRLL